VVIERMHSIRLSDSDLARLIELLRATEERSDKALEQRLRHETTRHLWGSHD
jgi:hypothetical protein